MDEVLYPVDVDDVLKYIVLRIEKVRRKVRLMNSAAEKALRHRLLSIREELDAVERLLEE